MFRNKLNKKKKSCRVTDSFLVHLVFSYALKMKIFIGTLGNLRVKEL